MEKSPGSTSPEFEFWMVGNPPSFPRPHDFLTADLLFADGVLLPLIHPHSDPDSSSPAPTTDNTAAVAAPATPAMSTRKWRQFFRSRNAKMAAATAKAALSADAVKERAKFAAAAAAAAAPSSCSSVGSAAELNIHIWPFSRSHSAGNAAAARQRASAAGRRSYSAPCSRSNSCGESTAAAAPKKRGPLAGGVPVGRSMPVWQLRRSAVKGGGGLNLNVNSCIGYGSTVSSCRGEDKGAVTEGVRSVAGGGVGRGNGGSLFNLRAIFSKKVH